MKDFFGSTNPVSGGASSIIGLRVNAPIGFLLTVSTMDVTVAVSLPICWFYFGEKAQEHASTNAVPS